MSGHAHDILMKKAFKILVGFISWLNRLCPECGKELNACNTAPCHICNVAGCIRPIRLWQRFLNTL